MSCLEDWILHYISTLLTEDFMKMEVTQSIILVYKVIGTFLSSHIVDNWACYSKYSRMILHHLLLNMNVLVYFYYGIMCDVFITMRNALDLHCMKSHLYYINAVSLLGVLITLMLFSLSINC